MTLYSAQISDLISSLIIFLCAFVGFFRMVMQQRLRKLDEKKIALPNANQEGGNEE